MSSQLIASFFIKRIGKKQLANCLVEMLNFMIFLANECACSKNLKELTFDAYEETPGNLDAPFLAEH